MITRNRKFFNQRARSAVSNENMASNIGKESPIKLFTSVFEDAQLLAPFLQFYARRGVDHVYMVVNEHGAPGLATQVRQALCDAPVHMTVARPIDRPAADMAQEMDQIRKAVVDANEYIIVADLDEFIEYPIRLSTLVQSCRTHGFLWVKGELLDRVTADGGIPRVIEQDIWAQFPLVGRLSRTIHRGRTRKCVLQRGDMRITPGHHGDTKISEVAPGCVNVHHFKWQGDLEGRLRRRIEIQKAKEQSYWQESQDVLEHLERHHGRIDVRSSKVKFQMSPRQPPAPGDEP